MTTSKTCLRPRILRLGILSWTYLGHKINVQDGKVKDPFCSKDVQKMWKYVDVTPFTDMVLIGIYTGFRPQELAILEIDNIDLEEGFIIGGMKTEKEIRKLSFD